jgi:hypothetical protein
MKPIPPQELIKLMERMLNFPFPQICRHLVACDILELLEKYGAKISQDLARAVVRAEDEEALMLLRELSS